jgi:hypothetical protein
MGLELVGLVIIVHEGNGHPERKKMLNFVQKVILGIGPLAKLIVTIPFLI